MLRVVDKSPKYGVIFLIHQFHSIHHYKQRKGTWLLKQKDKYVTNNLTTPPVPEHQTLPVINWRWWPKRVLKFPWESPVISKGELQMSSTLNTFMKSVTHPQWESRSSLRVQSTGAAKRSDTYLVLFGYYTDTWGLILLKASLFRCCGF